MSLLSFRWPAILWGLVLMPVLLAAYALLQQRRAGYAGRFASAAMMPNVAPHRPGWRRHAPVALYLLAMTALVFGLARPLAPFEVPRERATVMLVMDSSRSMLATDVQPTRLQAARVAAEAFLDDLPPRFQVGVVAFSDRAETLNRPTTDRVAVRRALASLETRQGTAIGDGVAQALQERPRRTLGSPDDASAPTVLLVLSDGNNTTGKIDPVSAAARARELGVRLYTIGVGRGPSADASPSPGRGPRPPNFGLLEDMAEQTGGRFFSAPSGEELAAVYRQLGSEIAVVDELQEVTVAFVGAGLLLLAAGGALSSVWFNRFP